MTATIFVTGATGFIGSRVARTLRDRGDEVVAVVRDPVRATTLRDLGVRVVVGDLRSDPDIRAAMGGADAVIHLAGSYLIGIPASARPAMYEANVTVTERVLDAAIALVTPRIVHISTINVLGNTHGRIPDETYRRDLADGFVSYYDETKYAAQLRAEARIATGAPIVIVQPGVVYGANDHSGVGAQLKSAHDGTARFIGFADMGISLTHVDDIAVGIVAALDRGRLGEAYILTADNVRLGDAMAVAARVGGRRAARLRVPNLVLRTGARLAPNAGVLFGLLPNLREIVSVCDGVTYWGSSAKAVAELGFAPRSLETGMRETFGGGSPG
ncbi:MAG: NAD-dependent epimerase/dehydratase family protein [Chloroflexota bacterium]